MKIAVGNEETGLLDKACKCFPRNPVKVNDMNGVASLEEESLHPWVKVDQAVGLCHQRSLGFCRFNVKTVAFLTVP